MKADLLLAVADHLDTVPNDTFNMGKWGTQRECGFAGCAVGHAAYAEVVPGLWFDGWAANPVYTDEAGKTYVNWRAVEVAFGLTEPEAVHLFDDDEYGRPWPDITPQMVADRIRTFVTALGDAS